MDQDRSEAQEKMKYFAFLILFASIGIDSKNASFFPRMNGVSKFSSTLQDTLQWSSDTRQYCFLEKELSYFLQYEFSPVPIPAFKLKNGLLDIYITVDIDPAHPIRLQKLLNAWAEFSTLNKNENICFEGAYLPASSPNDAAYIMIDQIKTKDLQLAVSDFWMELD